MLPRAGANKTDGLPPELMVRVEDLGKMFPIASRARRLLAWLPGSGPTAGHGGADDDEFDDDESDLADLAEPAASGDDTGRWALSGVSFDVARGHAVAVVGTAGAGKTTLLRILSGVTTPTEGRVVVRGRTSPLVEVAAALMRSDLTPPGNVRLLGRFLGIPRGVVARRTQAVLETAELTRNARIPLARCPTGAARRLAFAAALELEPNVVLMDDFLRAGSDFNGLALNRVEQAVRDGASVVFSSTDLETVERLATEAIWLDNGRVAASGSVSEVVNAFGTQTQRRTATDRSSSGHELALLAATVEAVDGKHDGRVSFDDVIRVSLRLQLPGAGSELWCKLSLASDDRLIRIAQLSPVVYEGGGRCLTTVELPPMTLGPGTWRGGVRVVARDSSGSRTSVREGEALLFDVEAPLETAELEEETAALPAIGDSSEFGRARGVNDVTELDLPWRVGPAR